MVGAFYALETDAGHGGLRRVALTRHGKASHCVCVCADGTEARSKAGENVADLLPVIAILLVVVLGVIPVAVTAQRRRSAALATRFVTNSLHERGVRMYRRSRNGRCQACS
jgi:hypothetical protein